MALQGFNNNEEEGFIFSQSRRASQGINQKKRIETASIVVATDESGDFQSIQEAINSLDDKGGYIQIKEGDFYIDTSIEVSSNITIEGVGYNSRVINSSSSHIFKNSDAAGGNENIKIKNIRCRGSISLHAAVYLENCENSQIEGIMTEQIYYSSYVKSCSRVHVLNCISLDANLGIGSYIESCYDCIIDKNNLFGESSSLELWDCENCVVTGNICSDAGDTGIFLDRNSNRNTITANQAADCTTGIFCYGDYNIFSANCAENAGIFLHSDSSYNIVTSNLGSITDNGTSNTKANNITI